MIGGTGLSDPGWLGQTRAVTVTTPYGAAVVHHGTLQGREVTFLPRHGPGHTVPPHRVNYRANIWALREVGARRVVATAACGSLRPDLGPGSLVLPDQFLDFTRGRPSTFFDGGDEGVRHTDVSEPYCPELRALLGAAAAGAGLPLSDGATYVCTEGPRFETPAEIRMFRMLGGDLVGMTGVPEVVLAREAGLCYAAVGLATNFAAGLAGRPLTHEEVVAVMTDAGESLRRLFGALVARLPESASCACGGDAARG